MVPHITDAIQEWVVKQARVSVDDDGVEPEVCIIEVSGCRVLVHFISVHDKERFSCHRRCKKMDNVRASQGEKESGSPCGG